MGPYSYKCEDCGAAYHRESHKEGCKAYLAFLNQLGAKKAKEKAEAREFFDEHFVVVKVP